MITKIFNNKNNNNCEAGYLREQEARSLVHIAPYTQKRRHCKRHRRNLLKTACFYHTSTLLCFAPPPPPSPFREGEAPVRPIICVTILECGKIKIQQFNNRLGSLIKFPKF